jgi:repressor LexA
MPAGAFYPASTESAYVSLYGTIAAGEPLEMCEVEDSYPVIRDIVDKYPEGFLLKVVGESMNKSIPNGSYAYVTPTSEVVDGKIYALNVNGFDATIKRVRRLNNGYELIPDSSDPTFETKVYNYGIDDTEQITIIGRVVYYVLPLDFEM